MSAPRVAAPSPVAPAAARAGRVVAAVVLVAVALPVAAVLLRAVRPDGAWDAEAVGRVLGEPRTWRVVGLTVAQAVASCAVTLAVGVPVAWVLSRFRFRGRGALRTLAVVPFVLPSVVVGAAFASLLGPTGPADLRGTWWAVLAAHLCFNLAVVLRVVGAALDGVDPEAEAAARLLGAGPWSATRRVVLPAVRPAVASAAVVVFLFCLTSFGVVVLLGGGAVTTVEVEIWVRATRQFDLPGAAVLAAVQLVAVVAALGLHARISRAHPPGGGPGGRARTARRPRTPAERLAVAAAAVTVLAVSVLPLLALVERSLRVPDGHGWDHWASLGSATAGTGLAVRPVDAVLTSLVTAGAAAALALALAAPAALAAARRPGGWADRALLLPLAVSATTVGLGLLLVAGRPPVDLRRSWWLVPVAQALVALPLAVRAMVPGVRAVPDRVLEAATVLGATGADRWRRVELPLLRPALVAAGGLALLACLGEFGATVFLSRSDRVTVPVAVERLLSRPGADGFGQAMALSCVLVLVCTAVLFVVDRVGGVPGHGGGDARAGLRLGL